MAFPKAFDAFQRGRLWDKYEHYFEIYDRFLRALQGREVRMLEIGVGRGGSIMGWQEYFGRDQLHYFGLDIDPNCKEFERDGVTIFVGDQADRARVQQVADQLPALDLIIDDGGHVAEQQVTSFEVLFPRLACGGIYIVEDTHTSLWSRYRSALPSSGPERVGAIEYFSSLVSYMMDHWWDEDSRRTHDLPRSERPPRRTGSYAQNIYSISFFDSLVVVEKRDIPAPLRIRR